MAGAPTAGLVDGTGVLRVGQVLGGSLRLAAAYRSRFGESPSTTLRG